MKKLKKASLNELAEKMPLLNEQEKAEQIGGNHYFSSKAGAVRYYGKYGNGEDIYLISPESFSTLKMLGYVPSDGTSTLADSSISKSFKNNMLRTLLYHDSFIKWVEVVNGVNSSLLARVTGASESGTISGVSYPATPGVGTVISQLGTYIGIDNINFNNNGVTLVITGDNNSLKNLTNLNTTLTQLSRTATGPVTGSVTISLPNLTDKQRVTGITLSSPGVAW